ncbi:hypothetical protein BGX27_006658 [Mortierella sp. AM989]|nr:hypothetical protein BGX27_006658 [Mortierella sp. AM989]
MSISIDPQEGGPIESLFGGQVEQRIGHHVEYDDERPNFARRTSESEGKLLGVQSTQRSVSVPPLSPRPGSTKSTWAQSLSWTPWRQWRPSSSPSTHRSQLSSGNYHSYGTPWWGSRLYNKISLGILPTSTGTTASASTTAAKPGVLRNVQTSMTTLVAHVAGIASNKRRKSWFLSLIFISLALTILSGGYLLTQFQHQRDHIPPALPGNEDVEKGDLLLDPGSGGPRRDRNRGKKHKAPKKPSMRQNGKNETSIAGSGKLIPNIPGPDKGNADGATALRICNLGDVADGQWIYSKTQKQAPAWGSGQNMSWTGYGHSGCRSTIWNERYLLAPALSNDTTARHPSASILQNDWDYAHHLRNFQWRLAHNQEQSQKSQEGAGGICRQTEMDVEDFVEVLKRAPLVMIGDKFLEQEYLTIECMVLGMQNQLVFDYRSANKMNPVDEKAMKETLEYWVEAETPPVIELKVAPQTAAKSEGISSSGRNRSAIYRKAKPGQMRLVDRTSNLTLVTFIRSDVLWDSAILKSQTNVHLVKPAMEFSSLDVSGLHPDCKLVGTVLLCEPARIDLSHDGPEGHRPTKPLAAKHWWQWWIGVGDDDDVAAEQLRGDGNGDEDVEELEEDMSFGSDFDHDMINLEWVQALDNIVQDTADYRANSVVGVVERKPVVMISNGHFWEYDPQDATALFSLAKSENQKLKKRGLSKKEQEQLHLSQIKRKRLLRQRYTVVLTNMLDYIKATYPNLRVMAQTSVRCNACRTASNPETRGREAALLNVLTKTVVARMQDPLYSFLDTTFLRHFRDSLTNRRYCNNFMMPGPLDTLVHHLYGELFRLDL